MQPSRVGMIVREICSILHRPAAALVFRLNGAGPLATPTPGEQQLAEHATLWEPTEMIE